MNVYQDEDLAEKAKAQLTLFSYNDESAMEILQELAYTHKDEEVAEKAMECFENFFDEYDMEDLLYLEERLEDDPAWQ